MKTMSINEYNPSLGKLIDIEEKEIYNMNHVNGAINIPYEILLYNKDRLLNKSETYYIYCKSGHKSKRLTNILNAYGFKVVQVLL